MDYIKSPLNYTGGKHKLLGQILPLFPEGINTFVDLFGGGFNVGINVGADKIVYNDGNSQLVELMKHFYTTDIDDLYKDIFDTIKEFKLSLICENGYAFYECKCSSSGLSEYNKDKYLDLRKAYNDTQDPVKLYLLIVYAFSNQMRFNSKGGFNMPVGKRDFNIAMQDKLRVFCEELHKHKIEFWNKDFREWEFTTDMFVYCDPPYLNSIATYNASWTEKEEIELLAKLDELDKIGKFALSNNLKYKNPLLEEWMDKYHVHYLSSDYSHCNYQKKDRSKDTEVLITNY